MSRFDEKLPAHIRSVKNTIYSNLDEIAKLNEGMHECDCEYCDRGIDSNLDQETIDKQIEQYQLENKDLARCIARLKQYASDRSIALPDKF